MRKDFSIRIAPYVVSKGRRFCRAIAAQYARPSALYPQGIRAFAPGYVLDRCAVCAHTPGEFKLKQLMLNQLWLIGVICIALGTV